MPFRPTHPPSETDRRKARDAALRTQDEAIAEHLAEAMRNGELRAAPSFGKPLAHDAGWDATPPELRMPFKILKNAGVPPPEIDLFHRRAQLREALAQCLDAEEQRACSQRLAELEQVIALRLEGLRVNGRL